MSIDDRLPASRHDDLSPLLDRVRAGDQTAVERLLVRVRDSVRQWAARFTRDLDEADDVAQEVLVALPAQVKRFDQRRSFGAWLYVLTRRAALSTRRTEWRRRSLLKSFLRNAVQDDDTGDTSSEETALLTRLVLTYFDALPRRQRQVFEMAELRGMPHTVVARELGMREVTVRAHLFKARATIRRKLLQDHEALVREYKP